MKFKEELIRRINATYKKAESEPKYSPFLKSFGKTIVPASIQLTEIPESKYIMTQLENLTVEVQRLRLEQKNDRIGSRGYNQFEQKRIITSFLNAYPYKHSHKELLEELKINNIRKELFSLGVDISNQDLADFIIAYYNNNTISDKEKLNK